MIYVLSNNSLVYQNGDIYRGEKRVFEPHGDGRMEYYNGNIYEGNFKFGKPDGFGKLTNLDGSEYIGYFSDGDRHGIGTFRNENIIRKGRWCRNKKHGDFILSCIKEKKTRNELWKYDNLIRFKYIDWKEPSMLETYKNNPHKKPLEAKYDSEACSICYTNKINSAMNGCGHVGFCYDCIKKLDTCPMCRRKGSALKLYSIK